MLFQYHEVKEGFVKLAQLTIRSSYPYRDTRGVEVQICRSGMPISCFSNVPPWFLHYFSLLCDHSGIELEPVRYSRSVARYCTPQIDEADFCYERRNKT